MSVYCNLATAVKLARLAGSAFSKPNVTAGSAYPRMV